MTILFDIDSHSVCQLSIHCHSHICVTAPGQAARQLHVDLIQTRERRLFAHILDRRIHAADSHCGGRLCAAEAPTSAEER